jgi:hypothetical protein
VFFVQTKRAGALTRVVRVKKGGRPNDLAPPPSHKYKKIENLLFPFYFSNIRPRDVFITGYNVVWHSTAVSRHFATLCGIQPPYRGILRRYAAFNRRIAAFYNVVRHSTAVSRHFATLYSIQPPFRGNLNHYAAFNHRIVAFCNVVRHSTAIVWFLPSLRGIQPP